MLFWQNATARKRNSFCQHPVLFQSGVAASAGPPLECPARHSEPHDPPAAGPPAVSIARAGGRRLLRVRAAQSEEPPVPAHESVVRRVAYAALELDEYFLL